MEKTNISYSYHVCCLFSGEIFFHIHRIFYPLISWLSKHQFVNPMLMFFYSFWKQYTYRKYCTKLMRRREKLPKIFPNWKLKSCLVQFFSHFRCAPHADSPNLIQFQEKKIFNTLPLWSTPKAELFMFNLHRVSFCLSLSDGFSFERCSHKLLRIIGFELCTAWEWKSNLWAKFTGCVHFQEMKKI